MYITTRQKRKIVFKVGSVLLVLLIIFSIFLLFNNFWETEDLDTRASEVFLTNFSDDSVTVNWVTEDEVNSYIKVYMNEEEVGEFESLGGNNSRVHYVDIDDLDYDSEYTFEIVSGGDVYDDFRGDEFVFKTTQELEHTGANIIAQGELNDVNHSGLIFLLAEDIAERPVSTYFLDDGKWELDVSQLSYVMSQDIDNFDVAMLGEIKLLFFSPEGSASLSGRWNDLFDESNSLKDISLDENVNVFDRLSDSDEQDTAVMGETDEGIVETEEEYYHTPRDEEVEWGSLLNTDKLNNYGVY